MINPDPQFVVYQFGQLLGDGWNTCDVAQYEQMKAEGRRVRRLAVMPSHLITARTWYGSNGGEFVAELRDVESGNVLFTVGGTTWGSDAWSYAMRDAMHVKCPNLFPHHADDHPTRYFREVCNVPYEHHEVARKRDL